MTGLIDKLPWWLAIAAALTLGLAPLTPEPHIVEKIRMLVAGMLTRPIDILDLAMHGAPWLLVVAKAARHFLRR